MVLPQTVLPLTVAMERVRPGFNSDPRFWSSTWLVPSWTVIKDRQRRRMVDSVGEIFVVIIDHR